VKTAFWTNSYSGKQAYTKEQFREALREIMQLENAQQAKNNYPTFHFRKMA
jgi:meiotically up-regulated gene 157 (Mug157) protein